MWRGSEVGGIKLYPNNGRSEFGAFCRALRTSLIAEFENGRNQMISGGFEGHLIYCRLKFWRQSRQNAHNGRAKLAVFAGVLRDLKNGVRKRGLSFLWSQRTENQQKTANVQGFVMMSR